MQHKGYCLLIKLYRCSTA